MDNRIFMIRFFLKRWYPVVSYSVTIERVLTESRLLWRYQRFYLILEYTEKTALPRPLNIICILIELITYIYHRLTDPIDRDRSRLGIQICGTVYNQTVKFEWRFVDFRHFIDRLFHETWKRNSWNVLAIEYRQRDGAKFIGNKYGDPVLS